MRRSLKQFLFFFLPIFCLVFFQLESKRIDSSHRKIGYVNEHGDLSSDIDDDNSITLLAEDDDGDDATETIARITPSASDISFSIADLHSYIPVITTRTRKISYRDISPSFLRVFRI